MAGNDRTAAQTDTPLGVFGVEATAAGVVRIRLPGDHQGAVENGSVVANDGASPAAEVARSAASQIAEYAGGERETFDVSLHWDGVADGQRRVLETLLAMAPYGRTVTYGELGAAAGVEDPRDVGVHMNRNPFPIVVPCHRVVAADGLGGYGGGLALKRRLLELEGALPPSLDLGNL